MAAEDRDLNRDHMTDDTGGAAAAVGKAQSAGNMSGDTGDFRKISSPTASARTASSASVPAPNRPSAPT